MAEISNQFEGLDREVLGRAVAIYLATAYPGREPPPVVRRRLDWPEGLEVPELLEHPPFERGGKADAAPIYALRLGNAAYPHMKLQVQAWPHDGGYLLSVNTHDQILAPDPHSDDAEAFRALQAENARVKEQIEQAWDAAGLPTFLRYLREYLRAQPGGSFPESMIDPGLA